VDGSGTWVIDLDGVIWLTGEAIPGGAEAVGRLRAAGSSVLFASNNASPTVAELLERLSRAGIEATAEEVVTSAQAAASMIEPGSSVLAVADPGVTEALAARGITVVTDGRADAVVVGLTHRFDYDVLAKAARTIRNGARLIGTNEDPSLPTADGLQPGAGSLLAAVATASGATPEVAGKPHEPLARLIQHRTDRVALCVGDRPSTDGALAALLGVPFALVLTGVVAPGAPLPDPPPAIVADDFGGVVAKVLGEG
jgi:HAD superfamily hydrolase (TIGR01450 family)